MSANQAQEIEARVQHGAKTARETIPRIRQLIQHQLSYHDVKRVFWEMCSPAPENDEYLVVTICEIVGKMNKEEKMIAVSDMTQLVMEDYEYRMEKELLVDKIFKKAWERGDISANLCFEGLAITGDFTMQTPLNSQKYAWIRDNLDAIDYKGVRTLFGKLVRATGRLPQVLSPDQRRSLVPVEEILLHIMDRRNNCLPSLFVMSELQRDTSKFFVLPRLAAAATRFENSYRPTAELTQITGRPFLFPLPGHPMYTYSAPAWRITPGDTHIAPRAQLPSRIEFCEPQSYTVYAIRKQPRVFRDQVMMCFRMVRSEHGNKAEFTTIIAKLVLDALAEAEALSPDEELPRYQWENIHHIVAQEMQLPTPQISTQTLLHILAGVIKKSGFRRGLGELKWLLLQIATLSKNIEELMGDVVKLWEACRDPGEPAFTAASDHPARMVKYLAAASMWLYLEGRKIPDFQMPADDDLHQQLRFVRQEWPQNAGGAGGDGLMAVCLNTQRNESPLFKEMYHKFVTGPGQPDTPFLLSYGRQAVAKLEPWSVEFFDSLTLRAKTLATFQFVQLFTSRQPRPDRVQSPALVAPLYFALEHLVIRSCWWVPWNETMAVIGRIMCKSNVWQHLLETHGFTHFFLPPSGPPRPPAEALPICPEAVRLLLTNWFHVFKISAHGDNKRNQTGDPPEEILKQFLYKYPMPKSQFAAFPPFIQELNDTLDMTAYNAQSYEEHGQLGHRVGEDFIRLNVPDVDVIINFYRTCKQQPSMNWGIFPPWKISLCVAFRCFQCPHDQTRLHCFSVVLMEMMPMELVLAVNTLADYVLWLIAIEEQNQHALVQEIVEILDRMLWQYHFFTLDRLMLALAVHPTSDDASKWGIYLLWQLLTMPNFQERARYYAHSMSPSFLPIGPDFCQKLVDFHKRFPELTHREMAQWGHERMVQGSANTHPQVNPQLHMPLYYSSVIDRILPACDFILGRVIELDKQLPDDVFTGMLNVLAPLYKFHPYPITFVYNTLFCLHDIVTQDTRARQLTTAIIRDQHPFTASFTQSNHTNAPLSVIILELAQRFSDATEFVLKPPEFVAPDWRFAEFAPGVHTVTLACIELMASPHSPEKIVQGMISTLCTMQLKRPHQVLNALSQFLNALPAAYGMRLANEVIAVLDELIADKSPESPSLSQVAFSYFEEDAIFMKCTKYTAVIALAHAYWFQSNLSLFLDVLAYFEKEVFQEGRIEKMGERELFFMVRLLVPTLQRCYDIRERSAPDLEQGYRWKDCMTIIQFYYLIVGEVSSHIDRPLEYEDALCDLFYHFKYLYVGDYVNTEPGVDATYSKMHSSMREKLRYIIPSGTEEEVIDDSSATIRLAPKISVDITQQQGAGLGS
ncbi:unnamed protein product, partial [Mesorhabditis spiculigera]